MFAVMERLLYLGKIGIVFVEYTLIILYLRSYVRFLWYSCEDHVSKISRYAWRELAAVYGSCFWLLSWNYDAIGVLHHFISNDYDHTLLCLHLSLGSNDEDNLATFHHNTAT